MPKILYIGPCHPDEKSFGAQMRTRQICTALATHGDLDIIALKVSKDWEMSTPTHLGSRVIRIFDLEPVVNRTFADKIRVQFDSSHMNYHGHRVNREDRHYLDSILPDYDLVWMYNIQSANRLGRWKWNKSVMDIDDVPSNYLRSLRAASTSPVKRLKLWLQQRTAWRREQRVRERFASICVSSVSDRNYLDLPGLVHVIPNGFPVAVHKTSRIPFDPPRLGFIGTFAYGPNAEGVRWFLRECWPEVRSRIPGVQLRLVGKESGEMALLGGEGVEGLGWVADPAEEMATWSATIVPVLTGAGTRVKIAEALSRRCPIVSTSLGAHGYLPELEQEIYVADTSAAFTSACVQALDNPMDTQAMADRGEEKFLQIWSWDALSPRVKDAVYEFLFAGRNTETIFAKK